MARVKPERWRRGETKPGIPVDAWNAFCDTAELVLPLGPRAAAGPRPESQRVTVLNTTANLRPAHSVVQLGKHTLKLPTDITKVPSDTLGIEALAPAADKPFAILTANLAKKVGAAAEAIFSGYAICKVDVKDAAHTTAGPIDDDYEKLESGKSGCEIVTKARAGEAVKTGVQWCLVKLGGGGDNLVMCLVTETLSAATLSDPLDRVTPAKKDAYLLEWENDYWKVGGAIEVIWPSTEEKVIAAGKAAMAIAVRRPEGYVLVAVDCQDQTFTKNGGGG